MFCFTVINLKWLIVKGPVNPTQHGNMTFSVLEGAQQYCFCFQHTACRQLTEQGAYLNLQVAGFRVDVLYWCWAFPQITIQTVNECYNVFFNKRRMAVKCRLWCFISWSTSMSSQQYRPLLAVPDRKSHLVKERRASPTKQSVVAPIAAKKPLLLPKEGWPGW